MADLKDDWVAVRIEREPESGDGRTWVWWLALLVVMAGSAAAAWTWFGRATARHRVVEGDRQGRRNQRWPNSEASVTPPLPENEAEKGRSLSS